jgi:transposase InsO family protein
MGDFPTLKMYRSPTTWAVLSFFSWDLKGPLPSSLGGRRYALFGVCRVTRKRLDYYFKKKSEVTYFVIHMAIPFIKRLGGCMKVFKSDNGGEFVNTTLLEALEKEGIHVEHTSLHSPHQNGVSERTNRTVIEIAFTIMYAANTPIKLWPYACRVVIYVLERLPTRATNMETTAFLWVHGYVPDVSYFRTFGCDAYACSPTRHEKTS